MLIDSGADVTLIPQTCAERLGLRSELREGVLLRGFDGTASAARVVEAEMLFLGCAFRGRFHVIDSDVGILGRNVLNQLSLVLDGPRLNWREGP
jgi:predicted aspartyl protease